MGTDYAGNPASFPATVRLIDDSDPPNAANFSPPQKGLADRTANLDARTTFATARLGAYRLVEYSQTDFPDASEAGTVLVSWSGGAFGASPRDKQTAGVLTLVNDIVESFIYLSSVVTTAAATSSLRPYDSQNGGTRTQLPGCQRIQGPSIDNALTFYGRRLITTAGTYTIGIDGRLIVGGGGQSVTVQGAYLFATKIWRPQT